MFRFLKENLELNNLKCCCTLISIEKIVAAYNLPY